MSCPFNSLAHLTAKRSPEPRTFAGVSVLPVGAALEFNSRMASWEDYDAVYRAKPLRDLKPMDGHFQPNGFAFVLVKNAVLSGIPKLAKELQHLKPDSAKKATDSIQRDPLVLIRWLVRPLLRVRRYQYDCAYIFVSVNMRVHLPGHGCHYYGAHDRALFDCSPHRHGCCRAIHPK